MAEAPDPMEQLEAAIMARLGATNSSTSDDPTLAAALPGGVHSRTSNQDTFPFLTLSLVRQDDDYTFTGPWRHRFQYNIAVTDESEAVDASSAALQRVYELLQDAHKDPTFPAMEDFTLGFSRRRGRTQITPNNAGVTYQRISDEWRFEVNPR